MEKSDLRILQQIEGNLIAENEGLRTLNPKARNQRFPFIKQDPSGKQFS